MKKCVACGQKGFDDTKIYCPKCGIALIADTTDGLQMHGDTTNIGSARPWRTHNTFDATTNTVSSGYVQNSNSTGHGSTGSGSTHSNDNTVITPIGSGFVKSNGRMPSSPQPTMQTPHRSSAGYWVRRVMQLLTASLRYIIPAAMLVGTVYFAVVNWATISEMLGICIVGAIIGAVLLTWLSARGHHFTVAAPITGAVMGAFIGGILKYNVFNTADELHKTVRGVEGSLVELLSEFMPILIIVIGLLWIIRGFRR